VTSLAGGSADATPVHFDTRNDLALLRVDLDLAALPRVAAPRRGTGAAVLGYPENGAFATLPARFGGTSTVLSEDAYGRGPFPRKISSLRGEVRSGNSGGPLVDAKGRVLGTVFAASTSGPEGGYAVPNGVVAAALRTPRRQVDTGPCTG
jgi:S1-C subfamily serine protease